TLAPGLLGHVGTAEGPKPRPARAGVRIGVVREHEIRAERKRQAEIGQVGAIRGQPAHREQLAAAPDREAAVAALEPASHLVSRGVRAKPAVVLELLCRHDAELDREAGIGTDLRPVEARLVDDQPAVEGDGERAEEQTAKLSHAREYRAARAPRPLVPSSRWPS